MTDRVTSASFIGRERELARLEAALADAGGGRPVLAFLAGESGVGKSRLLKEFEGRAVALGARPLGGECIELGGDELPYAPLVGAIRPLARSGDPVLGLISENARCELARLAPELGAPPAVRADEGDGESQRRLFEALLELIDELGREAPVVLWLEDLHWADRSTRAFCAFLARSVREERLLAVLTYRPDELSRRHPMRPLLAELERGSAAARIELAPFAHDEVEAQLTDILGGEPDREVVERVLARSEGNPLFTEELLASGLDGRGGPSPTLRDALLLRLEGLGPTAQRATRALAVAGRIDDGTLATVTGIEMASLRAALREAVDAGVIDVDADGRFGFRHALLREVVYDDLLPGERADAHRDLAETLEAGSQANAGVWVSAAIAHHYHQAGDQPAALRTAVVAADESRRARAHGEAAALLDRALALWTRVEDAETIAGDDYAGILVRAARDRYLAGEDGRAVALLRTAREAIDPDAEPLRLAAVLGDLASCQWSQGHAAHARETLAEALALVPDEPTAERARLLDHKVRFSLLRGRFSEVEELAAQALADADAAGVENTRASVLNRLGSARFGRGEYERGEEAFRAALADAREHGSSEDLGAALANYADALNWAGRSDEAAELLAEGVSELDPVERVARWLRMQRAEIEFERGNWEQAEALLPHPGRLPRGTTLVNADLRIAEQALGRGHLELAAEVLTEAEDLMAHSVEPQLIAAGGVLRGELERRRRDLDASRKAIEAALDRIEFCTEDASRIARVAAAGVALEAEIAERSRDLGEAEAERDALTRLELMLGRVEAAVEDVPNPVEVARLASARAHAARGRGRNSPALWAEAGSRWDGLGRPYPTAKARWREAEAALSAGERERAAEAAGAALAIARRLGSTWLVAEVEGLGARGRLRLDPQDPPASADQVAEPQENPFELTDRELQVLALLATGATNREIGAELYMAEKTASVHVSRILGKLDVRSRTEAAALAHRQGLVAAATE